MYNNGIKLRIRLQLLQWAVIGFIYNIIAVIEPFIEDQGFEELDYKIL